MAFVLFTVDIGCAFFSGNFFFCWIKFVNAGSKDDTTAERNENISRGQRYRKIEEEVKVMAVAS